MRRRLPFAFAALAVAVPFVGAAAVHGCSDEQPFESVCLWVADPDNCYRKFRIDMEGAGHDCTPAGSPTPVIAGGDNGTANGAFLARDKLDVCFLTEGGTVVFDPPLDLTKFPPPLTGDPITYKMTFTGIDGTECGGASYTSPHGFSFTIDPPADAGGGTGGGAPVVADAGDGGPGMPYGSYTQVIQPGRDAFDVTCPTGETHHLNLYEVEGQVQSDDGGARSVCPVVDQLVPRADFTVNTGGIGKDGAVSFTIYWPPTTGEYPALDAGIQSLAGSSPPITPTAVTYFNCTIGAAPPTCQNGVKDGTETDIDCGGREISDGCPGRCGDGQGCITDCDCTTGFACTVMMGVRVCAASATTDAGSPACLCSNGVRDGDESDVDCGGSCKLCAKGQACFGAADCTSNSCVNSICE